MIYSSADTLMIYELHINDIYELDGETLVSADEKLLYIWIVIINVTKLSIYTFFHAFIHITTVLVKVLQYSA